MKTNKKTGAASLITAAFGAMGGGGGGGDLEINNPDACVGVVALIRRLQSALIPFVTTQSVRQNYTSVYSFDCKL
ncbi:hypothetical protein ABK01_09680 [Treponema sp. OMZ 305]|uniref:hypothetical protein n=1 Tax=Treponema sp. OMZ 305 TaxID=1659192 RepID=UPI0020A2D8DA|nr:hypothetical protein [Treponema sp. OMZ 305]UTC58506.1 hypothetical protein ABK01_09680 [Treponema sp. OMZ 305]